MKRSVFILLFVSFSLLSCNQESKKQNIIVENLSYMNEIPVQKQPVLVELFTSQGCSSCPPADAVLRNISQDFTLQQVIPISFHVDYWNYLGWKDTFSKSKFSDRQRTYNRQLQDGTYTPQIIINGKVSIVGSHKQEIYQSIKNQLIKVKTNHRELNVEKLQNGNQIELNFTTKNLNKGDKVHFILVEKTAEVVIKRGENHGKTIQYQNVVREWKEPDNYQSDKVVFDTSEISDYFLASFIQHENSEIYNLTLL